MKNANKTLFGTITRKALATNSLRLMVAAAVMFVSAFSVRAQSQDASVRVNFPFDSAVLNTNYMSNSGALATLDQMALEAIASNTKLDVVTYSSPEGNYTYNLRLSERRAKSISDYLGTNYPGIGLNIVSGAESWDDLRANVLKDTRLSENSRREILEIIDSNNEPDYKEKLLKANSAYKALYANYFRGLRYANISLRIEESAASDIQDGNQNAPETAGESAAAKNQTGSEAEGDLIVYYSLSEDFIRPDYMGNSQNLKAIHRLLSNPANRDKEIVLEGAASPEGPVGINNRLGKSRAQNLADWLVGQFPDLEGRIIIRSKGEDWEGLRVQVENCNALSASEKEEILSIIDSNDTPAKKEENLKALGSYSTVEKECLPWIRYAKFGGFEKAQPVTVPDTKPAADTTATLPLTDTVTTQATDTTAMLPQVDTIGAKPVQDTLRTPVTGGIAPIQQPVAQKRGSNTVFALKTNLLYDAVSALNVEVEVPIGERFSIMAEDVFPWWETGNKYCFQYWEMGVEGRFWFKPWKNVGTEKLRGFFVGPYVMSAKYDFQWDKSVNYQGEMWSVGVSAGYSMPIGKRKRTNLEFSLSLGYMQSPYRHYLPTDDYAKLIHDPALDGTFYNYFLYPTKAKVSLVVPINVPTRKEVSHD